MKCGACGEEGHRKNSSLCKASKQLPDHVNQLVDQSTINQLMEIITPTEGSDKFTTTNPLLSAQISTESVEKLTEEPKNDSETSLEEPKNDSETSLEESKNNSEASFGEKKAIEEPKVDSDKPEQTWNIIQVKDWVSKLTSLEVGQIFEKEDIDGEALYLLEEKHLQSMGLKVGAVLKLAKALKELKGTFVIADKDDEVKSTKRTKKASNSVEKKPKIEDEWDPKISEAMKIDLFEAFPAPIDRADVQIPIEGQVPIEEWAKIWVQSSLFSTTPKVDKIEKFGLQKLSDRKSYALTKDDKKKKQEAKKVEQNQDQNLKKRPQPAQLRGKQGQRIPQEEIDLFKNRTNDTKIVIKIPTSKNQIKSPQENQQTQLVQENQQTKLIQQNQQTKPIQQTSQNQQNQQPPSKKLTSREQMEQVNSYLTQQLNLSLNFNQLLSNEMELKKVLQQLQVKPQGSIKPDELLQLICEKIL